MREKTEKPTPKRLRDERKKGNISKSKEIATCAVIVGLFGYLWFFFDKIMIHIKRMITLPASYYEMAFEHGLVECLKGMLEEFTFIVAPFALTALVIIVLAHMLQFGVLFAIEPITPNFKRINPVEGFKRIFSLSNLLELIKSVIKVILLSTIVYLLIKDSINTLILIPYNGLTALLKVLGSIIKKLVLYISALFIVVAILDYFFQKQIYLKKLKMSLDEIKREHKDREGDPIIRRQRRQLHREIVQQKDMLKKIQHTTVIITQSKKIAVAVYYQHGKVKLPVIDVKAQSYMAERIIRIAQNMDVPIINDPSLAKELFAKGRENKYIPSELIGPIALALRSILGIVKA
jgi:type III secretion protein U